MKNVELMKEYIAGSKKYNHTNHLSYSDGKMWNYWTIICRIDRDTKKALFNDHRYSVTTSKIQGQLEHVLSMAGYEIIHVDGEPLCYEIIHVDGETA